MMPLLPPVLDRLNEVESILGPCIVLSLTETMIEKSTIDASQRVRDMLLAAGIHNYALQGQGARQHAVFVQTHGAYRSEHPIATKTSLYRPVTKQGDPRFCIYGLKYECKAGDQLAITTGRDNQLLVVLLTGENWTSTRLALKRLSPMASAVGAEGDSLHLSELYEKLRKVAAGPPLPSGRTGDTGVGFTLEAALGIPANSSKNPDYKDIELKFARLRPASREARLQLFARVPDWDLSPLKSSRQILSKFGYFRNGAHRLNCELNSLKPNSQGLLLNYDARAAVVEERSTRPDLPVVARWRLSTLEEALHLKHRHTMWVKCAVTMINGLEHFSPESVIYTRAPLFDRFPLLVSAGLISLDHMSKLQAGIFTERGPSWKLAAGRHEDLFGSARHMPLR